MLFKANVTVVKSDINAISQAIDNYLINNGNKAPDNLEVLVTPDENGHTYLKSLPLDPWKNPYEYISPGSEGAYEVISLGADGREGGEGENRDFSSESLEDENA